MESIFETMIPLVAILCAFCIPAAIIIILAKLRHDQRMEMIRQGINPDAGVSANTGKTSLFWGLLFTGIGIALTSVRFLTGEHDSLTGGVILLCIGIAILVYWKLTAPDRERRLYKEEYGNTAVGNRAAGAVAEARMETEKTPEE